MKVMEFPKQIMYISELEQLGFSRPVLERWVHIKTFPAFRTGKKGRWQVDTSRLEPWLKKQGFMKKDV